jgi:MFS family permease
MRSVRHIPADSGETLGMTTGQAASPSTPATLDTIETQIPARLDRLPWVRFHWLVVVGLGTVWILDGLEVTIVGAIGSRLTQPGSGLHIDAGGIGVAAAIYVVGACIGALFFGQLTDRYGRKKLFIITLGMYILATVATAFAFAPWYFYACRFFTGAGIGGEYSAINSAIDELIPARVRGRVDLIINGSYWIGSAAGAAGALLLLSDIFPVDLGWRLAFAIGALLGLTIMLVRRHVPESPRWLFIHGREDEAERIVGSIERDASQEIGEDLDEPGETLEVRQRQAIPFREIASVAFRKYPRRAVLGLALFVGQAFIYNGVTFDLGTLLGTFYHVSSGIVPLYLLIYAIGNALGPITLGRLFDTVGRKPMITFSYLGSAALAVVLGLVLANGTGGLTAFMIVLVATFFLASSGASAAYLTVSEIFPMETRALAIAFFYAVGTAVGGISGPLLFGKLINSGSAGKAAVAIFIGAAVMAIGGIAEAFFGVRSEGRNLEDIATPLTAEEAAEAEQPSESAGGRPGDEDGRPGEKQPAAAQPAAMDDLLRRARERERRNAERARTGMRRYRPGPGRMMSSPRMTLPPQPFEDVLLEREIERIESALREHGSLHRNELALAVRARSWGPGRFRRALRESLADGRVRFADRGRLVVADDAVYPGGTGTGAMVQERRSQGELHGHRGGPSQHHRHSERPSEHGTHSHRRRRRDRPPG